MSAAGGYTALLMLIAVTACRLICGLAVIKALSFILGPAQFGTISQIGGVGAAFYSFAGAGVTNGLILYAGGEQVPEARQRWLATALAIGAASSIVLAAIAGLLYGFGSAALLGDKTLAAVFLGIAAAQAVIGVGNILLAYASGTGDIKSFATANIAGTLAWASLTVAATLWVGFGGAVWTVTVAPICTALVILAILWRPLRLMWPLVSQIDRTCAIKLLHASSFMVLAICALPIAQTIVRADLAARGGWHDVGLWQAVGRLSDAYMQVFGVIAINLLLPRLLQRCDPPARNAELRKTGGAMLALFVLGATVLYLIREPVIRLAYSAEFLPATAYFPPQLGADFAKVGAWILVYRFVAAGRLWAQPTAEIFQAAGFVTFYYLLWPTYGSFAPVVSHLLSCIAVVAAFGIAAARYGE